MEDSCDDDVERRRDGYDVHHCDVDDVYDSKTTTKMMIKTVDSRYSDHPRNHSLDDDGGGDAFDCYSKTLLSS